MASEQNKGTPALSTQPYKGTRDFYPEDMRVQRWMFNQLREVVEGFGFQEYDGPMLEPFELYAAKSGEELVNQQLYTLIDRGERRLAVRPEMTPTMARMVAGKAMELPKPVRWFSIPNLWRYERPQRGRLREHWQLNVDVLGGERVLADAEILQIALATMGKFGGQEHISVKVNHRKLMDSVFSNPKIAFNKEQALGVCKAIDARAKIGEEKYQTWLGELGVSADKQKVLEEFFKMDLASAAKAYPGDGATELVELFSLLKETSGAKQVLFDPTIMRGLDYYTGTVFEIYDTSPENNRAMFGGGRYDNLVGMFGKEQLSGVGFGMGDVTLRNFLEVHALLPKLDSGVDVFVTLPKPEYKAKATSISQTLRAQGLNVISALSIEGFGVQLKQASKFGAKFVVLLGDDELKRGSVMLKNLATGNQTEVKESLLGSEIKKELK